MATTNISELFPYAKLPKEIRRLSMVPTDPSNLDYIKLMQEGRKLRVIFDGLDINYVLEADMDQGYVIVNAFDEQGRMFIQAGEIRTFRKNGEVRIIVS